MGNCVVHNMYSWPIIMDGRVILSIIYIQDPANR